MSFKKITQFKEGNFNFWNNLTLNIMPKAIADIRHTLLPTIDEILDSMLGVDANGNKKAINIIPTLDKDNTLAGLTLEITYYVEDFNIKEAPQKAIDQDTAAIKDVLSQKGFTIKGLTIDTQTGDMKVTMDLNLVAKDPIA